MWCCFTLALLILQRGDEPKPRPELPAEVKPIVALARAGPREFLAATLLKLVEGGKIPNVELQTQLLDEAFSAAANAHEPVRLIGIPGTPPDTRAIYRSHAGELKLDATSLESSVVKLLLTFDASHARQLFERTQTPQLDARPCADPLVPDASGYYEAAAAIAQAAFSATEKEKEAHVQFLQRILGGASSPSALAAFLRALDGVALHPSQRQLLMGAVAARMEALSADYRPFAISVESVQKSLEQLEARVRADGRDTAVLARAFRTYLLNQLGSPRCDEDIGPAAQAVTWFNTTFRGSLAAIEVKEIQPASRKGALVAAAYFESTDAKRISVALNTLRYGPNGPRSDEERASGEWRGMLTDVLRDVSAWEPEGSAADYFHQKAAVLRTLLEITPAGSDRVGVVKLCAEFLASSAMERDSPAEWLWQVRSIAEGAGADREALLEAFRESGDPGLGLFAALGLG